MIEFAVMLLTLAALVPVALVLMGYGAYVEYTRGPHLSFWRWLRWDGKP